MDNSAFLKQMQSDFDDSLDDIDEDLQTANGDPVVEQSKQFLLILIQRLLMLMI